MLPSCGKLRFLPHGVEKMLAKRGSFRAFDRYIICWHRASTAGELLDLLSKITCSRQKTELDLVLQTVISLRVLAGGPRDGLGDELSGASVRGMGRWAAHGSRLNSDGAERSNACAHGPEDSHTSSSPDLPARTNELLERFRRTRSNRQIRSNRSRCRVRPLSTRGARKFYTDRKFGICRV